MVKKTTAPKQPHNKAKKKTHTKKPPNPTQLKTPSS